MNLISFLACLVGLATGAISIGALYMSIKIKLENDGKTRTSSELYLASIAFAIVSTISFLVSYMEF